MCLCTYKHFTVIVISALHAVTSTAGLTVILTFVEFLCFHKTIILRGSIYDRDKSFDPEVLVLLVSKFLPSIIAVCLHFMWNCFKSFYHHTV